MSHQIPQQNPKTLIVLSKIFAILRYMIKKSSQYVIQSSKDILGGEPVFRGTRVPVRTLIEYLKAGDRLEYFLKDFPTVSKKQALEVLTIAQESFAKG